MSRSTTMALTRLSPILLRATTAAEYNFGRSQAFVPRQLSLAQPLGYFPKRKNLCAPGHRFLSDSSSDAKAKEEAGAEGEAEETTDDRSPDAEDEEPTLSEEEQKIANLEVEVKTLKDQLLRSLAEQDNIRRIARRDVESARNFAVQSFAKSLLDTSDNLTRAMDAVPEAMRNDKEDHSVLATLFEGIHMTDENLTKAFEKNGLVKFGSSGDKFDPNLHDAMFEYVDSSAAAGSVGQVLKVGFMLHGRVIRPAEVGVVKKE